MIEAGNIPVQEPFDRFNPKQVLLQATAMGRYLRSRWKIILLSGLILGMAGFTYSFLKAPDYVAEMTFALDEGAGQAGAVPSIPLTDQIILGSATEAGSLFSSLTNIVELMQSRLLIERTLRSPVSLHGKLRSYADFFLDSLDYREKWVSKTGHRNPDFMQAGQPDSLFCNGLLFSIYQLLTKKMIKIDQKGKGTTIVSVTCITQNEAFSKAFLEAWIHEVTQFYIDTKTERAKISLSFVTRRTDSVRNAYNAALYGRAAFADAMINPIRQTASISQEKQQTDIQILRASYVELVRSMETAKTTLLRDTPLIQFIDVPILPLKRLKSDLIKFTVGGFAGGVVLAAGWLLLRKIGHYLKV